MKQIKSLFVGEKQLCHEIFHDIDSLENLCFGAAIETSVDMLLSFGYAVAKHEWPPEKLFSLLIMHKVLHGLHPEVMWLYLLTFYFMDSVQNFKSNFKGYKTDVLYHSIFFGLQLGNMFYVLVFMILSWDFILGFPQGLHDSWRIIYYRFLTNKHTHSL